MQVGLEAGGLQLAEWVLLSVSGVTSRPTERCARPLGGVSGSRVAGLVNRRGSKGGEFLRRGATGCGLATAVSQKLDRRRTPWRVRYVHYVYLNPALE